MVGFDGLLCDVKVVKMVFESDLGKVVESVVKNFIYGLLLINWVGELIDIYYVVFFNGFSDKVGQQVLMVFCQLFGYDVG